MASSCSPLIGRPAADSCRTKRTWRAIAATTALEPLEAHYVTRHSRRQQGVLMFLARDAQQRVWCYGNPGISRDNRADEILRCLAFRQRQTGAPAERVLDTALTTYAHLGKLSQQGTRVLTLPALSRAYRTPRVSDEAVMFNVGASPCWWHGAVST